MLILEQARLIGRLVGVAQIDGRRFDDRRARRVRWPVVLLEIVELLLEVFADLILNEVGDSVFEGKFLKVVGNFFSRLL